MWLSTKIWLNFIALRPSCDFEKRPRQDKVGINICIDIAAAISNVHGCIVACESTDAMFAQDFQPIVAAVASHRRMEINTLQIMTRCLPFERLKCHAEVNKTPLRFVSRVNSASCESSIMKHSNVPGIDFLQGEPTECKWASFGPGPEAESAFGKWNLTGSSASSPTDQLTSIRTAAPSASISSGPSSRKKQHERTQTWDEWKNRGVVKSERRADVCASATNTGMQATRRHSADAMGNQSWLEHNEFLFWFFPLSIYDSGSVGASLTPPTHSLLTSNSTKTFLIKFMVEADVSGEESFRIFLDPHKQSFN